MGTEDVFLGLSDKDPSSVHCDSILVKVWLPGAKLAQVQLDVQKQMLFVQSPAHVLKQFLPYPVDKDRGKAQFDPEKGLLSVTVSSAIDECSCQWSRRRFSTSSEPIQ